MTIRRNKYDVRESLARKLSEKTLRRYNRIERYPKPVWNGKYIGVWTLKPTMVHHPKAEAAQAVLKYFPVIHCWGKELPPEQWWPKAMVSERVWLSLPEPEQKFFHWKLWWEKEGYTDRFGIKYYRIRPGLLKEFFVITIRKEKVKSIRRSDPEPEVEKIADFLYRTGFAHKYLWRKHHSDRYRAYTQKGSRRKAQRELEYQIAEGISQLYEGECHG